MKSRSELQEFFTSDQIDSMYEMQRREDRKYKGITIVIASIPIIVLLASCGYELVKDRKISNRYENAKSITREFEENEHTIAVPVETSEIANTQLETHDGYEIISLGDGQVIYTNVEPVEVNGLLFEDGSSEFTTFGTVIEEEKTK